MTPWRPTLNLLLVVFGLFENVGIAFILVGPEVAGSRVTTNVAVDTV
jgi:hypothetical protein